MEISSPHATTIRQIEGGIRGVLVDMNESVNPFEVGQDDLWVLIKTNLQAVIRFKNCMWPTSL